MPILALTLLKREDCGKCNQSNMATKVINSKFPVIVNFGAVGCGFCRASEPTVQQTIRPTSRQEQVIVVPLPKKGERNIYVIRMRHRYSLRRHRHLLSITGRPFGPSSHACRR